MRPRTAPLVDGALRTLRVQYVTQACVGEGIGTHTIEATEIALAAPFADALQPNARIASNLSAAIAFVLDTADLPFTVETVCRVHAIVGTGVVPNPGEFRTHPACPVGSPLMYKNPRRIAASLRELVDVTADAAAAATTTEDAVKNAARFMSSFLV